MGQVEDTYRGYFQALRAFNKQPTDVRRRVVGDYFEIAAVVLPEGRPRELLCLYGLREAQRLPPVRDAS